MAAPTADLWEVWNTSESSSNQSIDHQLWDEFLAENIRPDAELINRVAYANVSKKSRKKLKQYLEIQSSISVRLLTKDEQLAYWINLYNALTVEVILEHYPVESIKDISISPGWFDVGPWDKKLIMIEDEEVSLNDIEHRILRPIWNDPRIHYALNCASIGCPNLARKAYTSDNVESLLNQSAIDFINHPRGVTVGSNGLVVSEIYDWFQEDFGGTEEGVLNHLSVYAKPALKERIQLGIEIDRYRYDWALNDAVKTQYSRKAGS